MGLFKQKVVKDALVDEEIEVKKSFPKWVILVGVVAVIVLMLIIKAVSGGKSTGINYYDTMAGIFTNELGTFKYVIDVRTGEKGTIVEEIKKMENTDVTNVASGAEDTAEETETTDELKTKYQFSDWGTLQEVQSDEWVYPNYKITIEGCTTSIDPLVTNFTISLATKYYNNVFTDVTCINGYYYINVEGIRDWLINSKDSYLIEIGTNLPQGSKYLVLSEDEFVATSRFAEVGEVELSSYKGLRNVYQRFLVTLSSLKDVYKQNLGDLGITSSEGTATLYLDGTDALKVFSATKGIVAKTGDIYDGILKASKSKELYDDAQYEQAVREKDNVIAAFYDMLMYLNITDFNIFSPQISGVARQLVSGKGTSVLEGNLAISFCTGERDVMVQFSGSRTGAKKDIYLPQGSQLKLSDMTHPTQLSETINRLVDYLNITNIKLGERLELSPENISRHMKEDFIDLVNSVGTTEHKITLTNVQEFIDKYLEFEETSETTAEDVTNAKMVSDFVSEINKVTGGVVVEKIVYVTEEAEQYPVLEFNYADGLDFRFEYNDEASDSRLLVLDGILLNRTDEEFFLDTCEFNVRTLLNSKYPANNKVLLRNYNSMIDFDAFETAMTVPPRTYVEFKLNIVLGDDAGQLNLFYKDEQRGVVVQY